MTEQIFYHAIGRRKTSTARVRLRLGNEAGIIVNEKPISQYFSGPVCEQIYLKPFKVTNTLDRFSARIQVSGGGLQSQLGAVVHGISRALFQYDETFKSVLRKHKLLTRDPRMKESRKYGHAQKARAKKSSPKR